MDAEAGSVPRRRLRFQFSLATLMGGMAAVSLLSAMWTWRGERGALEFFLGTALCVTAIGLWRRRFGLIVVGLVLLAGIQFALDYAIDNTTISSASGQLTAVLGVTVVDAVSGRPIPRAAVRLLRGGSEVDGGQAGPQGAVDLAFDVPYTLTRYRSVLLSREERLTNTRGVRLEIKAEGFQPSAGPLSRHLGPQCKLDGAELPPITVGLRRQTRPAPGIAE